MFNFFWLFWGRSEELPRFYFERFLEVTFRLSNVEKRILFEKIRAYGSKNSNFYQKNPVFGLKKRISNEYLKTRKVNRGIQTRNSGVATPVSSHTYVIYKTPKLLQTRFLRVLGKIRGRKKFQTTELNVLFWKILLEKREIVSTLGLAKRYPR